MEKENPIISIPAIKKADVSGSISQNFEVKFKDRRISFSLDMPRSIYLGAKYSEKSITVIKGTPEEIWAPYFFKAFIEDPVQRPVIVRLLNVFRQLRNKLQLNSDEYFELLLAFTQQIPYDHKKAEQKNTEANERFPVEVLIENKGLCGEKAFLLAALLKEEGYDIALLSFRKEEHMMLGIRPEKAFGTMAGGYVVLEVTSSSLPGDAGENADTTGTLYEKPQVIPVGNGTLRYRNEACREVSLILKISQHLQNKIDTEDVRIEQCVEEINKKERYLKEKYSELKKTQSRIQQMSWVEAVSAKEQFQVAKRAYNSEVKKQRARMEKYSERGSEFNQMVEVYNFILENSHNRAGILRELDENFSLLRKVLAGGEV